jgi:hypothetical protein
MRPFLSRCIGAALLSAVHATAASAQWRTHFADARPDPWRVSVVVTNALATYTASHNEFMDGAFRSLAAQVARPLFRVHGTTIAWLGEITPAILVTSEAPADRVPLAGVDPEANNAETLARYARHNGFGVGFAPLGAEASRRVTSHTRVVLNVTSGVAWFNNVVPYGRATQGNFTVAPGLFVERTLGTRGSLAAGYVLHHLSNASFGGANPGMNSHLVSLRWTHGAAR